MPGADGVPIVGQPVVYGIGFAVLVVLVFARFVGRYPLTLAHEGGHMLAAVFSLRRVHGFRMDDNTEGVTTVDARHWAPSNLVLGFAGYAAPPLLGLGGAALIASGNGWSVLVLTSLLCLLAIVAAADYGLAFLVPLLIVAGIVWALIGGSPDVRAAVAVGIVWYLLLGGVADAFELPTTAGDAPAMARSTMLVPAFVWKLAWIVLALWCLYRGGRLLFGT